MMCAALGIAKATLSENADAMRCQYDSEFSPCPLSLYEQVTTEDHRTENFIPYPDT